MNKYIEIKINGQKLPSPSFYKPNYEDLDAEGIRPITTGILKRNRIREKVLKVELKWNLNDMSVIESIADMVKDETLSVEIYDVTKKSTVTKEMYCSNYGYEYIRTMNGIKASGYAVNLIEV